MENIIEELKWRGLIHDIMPGTEEHLLEKKRKIYIGFDPTSDSLHVGSLVPILLLAHLQKFGHRPIALVGGATGMIGDPSGKSAERNLLSEEILQKNIEGIQNQLSKFIDFKTGKENSALLLNNYDWMKDFSFIDFARKIGKHITVNYMMAKDSVKKRISGTESEGMSFTEFTYQLLQGYDFLHLFIEHECTVQMGGSDQWGNITTGKELIRRIAQKEAFAATCPLVTKADGTKFGKSEGGNIWLDANKTSAYKFYQFWLNTTDEDVKVYIKKFTFLDQKTIEELMFQHEEAPHLRVLQNKLAEEITIWVHGKEELEKAKLASKILFGKSTSEDLEKLDESTFLEVFEGVPKVTSELSALENNIPVVDVLTDISGFLPSKGEARRSLKQNGISVNKSKVGEDFELKKENLIKGKFVLLQKGKKNYFIVNFG